MLKATHDRPSHSSLEPAWEHCNGVGVHRTLLGTMTWIMHGSLQETGQLSPPPQRRGEEAGYLDFLWSRPGKAPNTSLFLLFLVPLTLSQGLILGLYVCVQDEPPSLSTTTRPSRRPFQRATVNPNPNAL